VHPPSYLRVLMAFHWCRVAYGRGPWDEWEAEWRTTYRPEQAPESTRGLLLECARAIPRASGVFFDEPLAPLERRPLVELFDLDAVSPARLAAGLRGRHDDSPQFCALRPSQQLAVYRLLRERSTVPDRRLDHAMTRWLSTLAATRRAIRGDT
jgi:hypothetical protein